MAEKYIALEEETSGYGTHTVVNDRVCFKILSESINTTREDYFAETTEFWTPASYAKGPFRSGGDVEVLMEARQFPKLLAMHLGDPTTPTEPLSGTVYQHLFTFGGTESVSATGLKSFGIHKGVGIETDRRFDGGVITDMEIEARAREVVGVTVSIVGNGKETLTTASTANYISYSGQRYLTFADANTMTVGGTDRLSTDPTIEAFTIHLGRGYDTDHYNLGSEYMANQTLHGFAVVDGSMDFTFTSEDEHERFLSIVGGTTTGEQSGHITVLTLRGDQISSGYYNEINFEIPETYMTASEANNTGRDRIVQTMNYRGNHHTLSGYAVLVTVQNTTSSYTAITNAL